MFSHSDHEFMARALRLAERGWYSAHPNPRVGCVIARGDEIIAEGWHQRTGEPHAEINALEVANNVAGATVYVTLEPCVHHGRTPPCVTALIEAKPARVMVAMRDPNPQVTGLGVSKLQQAGITVEEGLLAEEALTINPGFVKRMKSGLPRVILKIAASLDGRTSLADGASKWITGDAAREDVHHLRAECGAVLTGSGTVNQDDPSLNVRLPGEWMDPIRVVIDSGLSISSTAKMLGLKGRTIIYTTDAADSKHRDSLQSKKTEIETVRSVDGKCDLHAVLERLGRREVNDVLVECGPGLSGALLQSGLVDECIIYLAPHMLGNEANSMALLPRLDNMSDRIEFCFNEVKRVGDDLRIRLKVVN